MKWLNEPEGFCCPSEPYAQAYHQGVDAVQRIRCMKHQLAPSHNTNANGDECGECIAEDQRDLAIAIYARVVELRLNDGSLTNNIGILSAMTAIREVCKEREIDLDTKE